MESYKESNIITLTSYPYTLISTKQFADDMSFCHLPLLLFFLTIDHFYHILS